MTEIYATAERQVSAPAERVYRILADYEHHQRILPTAFSDFTIEQGGAEHAVHQGRVVDRIEARRHVCVNHPVPLAPAAQAEDDRVQRPAQVDPPASTTLRWI